MDPQVEPIAECVFFLVAYFAPTIFAILQGRRVYNIFVTNLLFGWTVLGWVIAMAMAMAKK